MASSGAGGSSGGGASAAYGKAVGGRLKLKTVAAPATSVAASGGSGGAGGVAGVKRPRDGGDPRPSAAAPPPSSSSSSSGAAAAAAAAAPAVTAPSRTAGSGRIVTSGTAVYGIDTAFSTELAVGDAIEVVRRCRVGACWLPAVVSPMDRVTTPTPHAIVQAHPTSGVAEVRVIKMVLSDKSVGIKYVVGLVTMSAVPPHLPTVSPPPIPRPAVPPSPQTWQLAWRTMC